MRYKLFTIIIIIILVLECILFNNYYNNDIDYVYHQHLEDSSDETLCGSKKNCSHLPIVNINTNNQIIPGENKDKDNYIISDIDIYDRKKINILGQNNKKYQARIRYRGRSSIKFDKKGYLLKFIDKNNKKENVKFLGMPKDNEWVLHGPFIDKTLIRNYMWYNIGQEIMHNAPKTRFLELYVDNTYKGVYLAVESVSQSKKSRVKMAPIHKNSIATSYLLLLDSGADVDEIKKANNLSYYSKIMDDKLELIIKYPETEDLTQATKKYIKDDFSKFEKTLYSFDYKEYKKYIDVDNFVDYFIINEFTQNYDVGSLSTYIYKDVFGKYKMYIWDFNSANNNFMDNDFLEYQNFKLQNSIWFDMLIKDPDFNEAIINRYKELRKTYLSEEYLFNYIDETVNYLGPAIDRNFEVWGYTFNPDNKFKTTYMPTSHDDSIKQLKDAIHKRGEWMDKHIEDIKFYSSESKNKKYNK